MKLMIARFVVPMTSPVIEHGAVLVHGGRIREVGRAIDLRRQLPAETSVEDLGEVALLPGFVNPHTHLELTCYHGALPRAPLWQWFDHLLPLRVPAEAAARERDAVREGARQSLAAGVTLVGDISRTGLTAEALIDSPIRRVCFIELISGASKPPSTANELHAAAEEAVRQYDNDRTTIGISPHAPYTVTPGDLLATTRLATSQRLPLTMHLLETKEEKAWLEGQAGFLADFLRDRKLACAGHQPRSAAQVLQQSGLLEAAPLLAHVNYLDDATLALLAGSRASVVWCPRAHDYFGHSDHPWRSLVERGINVCVGTDSLASNASLSILDELRYVAAQYPDFDTTHLLKMGTVNAARALQLGDVAGRLAANAWADFCSIPCDARTSDEVVDSLLRGNEAPRATWVAGALAAMPADL